MNTRATCGNIIQLFLHVNVEKLHMQKNKKACYMWKQ